MPCSNSQQQNMEKLKSRGQRPSIDQTCPPVQHTQLSSRHKPPILSRKVTQAQGITRHIQDDEKLCCRGAQMRRLVYRPAQRACFEGIGQRAQGFVRVPSPPSPPILPTISESFHLTYDMRMLARLLHFCFRAHLGCGAEWASAAFVVTSLITGRGCLSRFSLCKVLVRME